MHSLCCSCICLKYFVSDEDINVDFVLIYGAGIVTTSRNPLGVTQRSSLPPASVMPHITSLFLFPLPFMALDFANQDLQINHTFHIEINNQECVYKLHGIVYYGDSHFTACVISNNDMVWYHDGIATGRSLSYEGTFQNFNRPLKTCGSKEAVIIIYVKV